ncbi:MAG: hypothetical protein J5803_00140, partial [Desulfovibrio sp.]|nr:hypothetical protein [Desulfovibrio sp.]MBR4742417.1 hypothetical protein [Desulfovibrio sp.]
MKNTIRMPLFSFFSILLVTSFLMLPTKAMAAELSQADAKRLLQDTALIESYLNLKGESDYVGDPLNIIKAALFGAFDAKMSFLYKQENRKEEKKDLLPQNAPLFVVDGKSVTADQVIMRDEASDLFKNLPETCTGFITRNAVELAALYFTGHRIKEHKAPKGDEMLGDTILKENGYYISIEGLG